jgi:hypothetical protein
VTRRSKSPENKESKSISTEEKINSTKILSTSTPLDSEMKKKRKSSLFKESESIQRVKSFFQGSKGESNSPKSPKGEKSPRSPKSPKASISPSDEVSETGSHKRRSIILTAMSFFQGGNSTPRSSRNSVETSPFLFEFDDSLPSNESLISFLTQKFCVKNFHLNFAFLMKFVPNTSRNVWKINFVLKILNFTK